MLCLLFIAHTKRLKSQACNPQITIALIKYKNKQPTNNYPFSDKKFIYKLKFFARRDKILPNIKVEIAGLNTSDLPVLNKNQKQDLLIKISQGDKIARKIFIYSNLRLVLSIIKKFHNRKESINDIFQIGCIGLIKAIDHFDINQGVQFSTYAVPMIIGEIKRHLRDNNSLRVSRSLRDIAYKVLSAKEFLVKKYLREPTIQEISEITNCSKYDIIQATKAIQDPVSLFDPVYSESSDEVCVMDQISDEKNNTDDWIDNICLKSGLKKISQREKLILQLRFFQGKTQTEVAEEIGISQAQISRLEKNALKNIKKHIQ